MQFAGREYRFAGTLLYALAASGAERRLNFRHKRGDDRCLRWANFPADAAPYASRFALLESEIPFVVVDTSHPHHRRVSSFRNECAYPSRAGAYAFTAPYALVKFHFREQSRAVNMDSIVGTSLLAVAASEATVLAGCLSGIEGIFYGAGVYAVVDIDMRPARTGAVALHNGCHSYGFGWSKPHYGGYLAHILWPGTRAIQIFERVGSRAGTGKVVATASPARATVGSRQQLLYLLYAGIFIYVESLCHVVQHHCGYQAGDAKHKYGDCYCSHLLSKTEIQVKYVGL